MKYVIVFNNSPVETNNYLTYLLNAIKKPRNSSLFKKKNCVDFTEILLLKWKVFVVSTVHALHM